jgi:hypothetical protein
MEVAVGDVEEVVAHGLHRRIGIRLRAERQYTPGRLRSLGRVDVAKLQVSRHGPAPRTSKYEDEPQREMRYIKTTSMARRGSVERAHPQVSGSASSGW